MAIMRNGEPRRFFDGESSVTVHEADEGIYEVVEEGGITEIDLAELSLRMLKSAQIDDPQFAETLEAMVEEYDSDEIRETKVKA